MRTKMAFSRVASSFKARMPAFWPFLVSAAGP